MIYTCYEMIRDCRAAAPAGWAYLVTRYVPVIRRIADRHATGDPRTIDRIVLELFHPAPGMFAGLEPVPERVFVGELRQRILAVLDPPPGSGADTPESVLGALEPLSLLERQAAWLAVMRYDAAETGRMLRTDPATIERARTQVAGRAGGGYASRWAAVRPGAAGPQCLAVRTFLDTIDGRSTWPARGAAAVHLDGCLFCLDHFCRMREAGDLVRDLAPLADGESAHFHDLLGIAAPKASGWRLRFG